MVSHRRLPSQLLVVHSTANVFLQIARGEIFDIPIPTTPLSRETEHDKAADEKPHSAIDYANKEYDWEMTPTGGQNNVDGADATA